MTPCPTCGSTSTREDWSTGQCDECFYEDHAQHWPTDPPSTHVQGEQPQ